MKRKKVVFVYVFGNAAHQGTISDGSTTVLMHVLRNAAHEETILDDAK